MQINLKTGLTSLCLVVLFACSDSQQQKASGSNASQELKEEILRPSEAWVQLKIHDIALYQDQGTADTRRNFYFIMDGSGSMKKKPDEACGGNQQFKTKMEGAEWALNQFLQQVPEDVNIGLYVFDKLGSREVVSLGLDNRDAFMQAIANMNVGHQTPLAGAIKFGTKQLVDQYRKQLGYGEYRLIIITDGMARGLPDAATNAASQGIPIYTIGLCVEPNHALRRYSVSYQAANDFEALAQGLQATIAELPNFDTSDFED